MGMILEALAVIKGKDSTGSTFDQVAKKMKGVADAAKALNSVKPIGDNFGREIERLKLTGKEMERMNRSWRSFDAALKSNGPIRASRYFEAVELWKSHTLSALRQVDDGMKNTQRMQSRFFGFGRFAGAGLAYYGAKRAVGGTIAAGAGFGREGARDYLAGLSDQESERLKKKAVATSAAYPSIDATAMHERLRDTAMTLGSVEGASDLADTIAQGHVVLQSLKGKDQALEQGRLFFKALDTLGKNVNPDQIKSLYDGYIKAQGVEGADLNLRDFFTSAKYMRVAGSVLSDRFLMTVMPGLGLDMGSSQAGNALASGMSQAIAGRATKESKAEQQRLGMRDKSGKFLDARMFMTDPDKYASEKLIPLMKAHGVNTDDPVAVTASLSRTFSNRTVTDFLTKLILQASQYDRKRDQYNKAPGLDAAGELPKRDAFVAYEGLLAQLRNFAATMSEPVFPAAIAGLNGLSSAIGGFVNSFTQGDRADKIAKGALVGIGGGGVLAGGVMAAQGAWGWLTGAGALSASAAALDGSAAALTAAAARIAAGGAISARAPLATGAAAGGAAGTAGGLMRGIWSGIRGGAAAAVPYLGFGAFPVAFPVLVGGAALAFPDDEQSAASRRSHAKTVRDAYIDSFNADRERLGISAIGGEPAKAEVVGNATLETTVTVSPSPDFLAKVDQRVDNKINAFVRNGGAASGSTGSTGTSSPDVGPAH